MNVRQSSGSQLICSFSQFIFHKIRIILLDMPDLLSLVLTEWIVPPPFPLVQVRVGIELDPGAAKRARGRVGACAGGQMAARWICPPAYRVSPPGSKWPCPCAAHLRWGGTAGGGWVGPGSSPAQGDQVAGRQHALDSRVR